MVELSHVNFIYITQNHKTQICLTGLYSLYSIYPQSLTLDEKKNFNRGKKGLQLPKEIGHEPMMSLPPQRPGKRQISKTPFTQRETRQGVKLNLLQDEDPVPRRLE